MKIERVEFTHDEAEKVASVMCDFGEYFVNFAKEINLAEHDANLLVQGAMMAFSTFSCVDPLATIMICELIKYRLYDKRSE